jgi:hypothetical protein
MRRYADDYEIAYEEDKKGREKKVAVYKGQYFEVNVEETHLVRFKRISVLLMLIVVLLHIGSGFVNHRETLFRYLELPYAIAFLPLYFLVVGVLRVPREKRQYRRDEVGLSFDRMKKASISLLIILLVGVLTNIVFLFLLAKEAIWQEYLYLALQALAALVTFIIIRLQKPIEVSVCGD